MSSEVNTGKCSQEKQFRSRQVQPGMWVPRRPSYLRNEISNYKVIYRKRMVEEENNISHSHTYFTQVSPWVKSVSCRESG